MTTKISCQVTRDVSGDNREKAFGGCQVTTKISSQGCQVTRDLSCQVTKDLSGDNMESEFAGCHLTTVMYCRLTTTAGKTLIVR